MTPVIPSFSVAGSDKVNIDPDAPAPNAYWEEEEEVGSGVTRWQMCQANQGNITVTPSNTDIRVIVGEDPLYEWTSSNPYQGKKAWIVLDVNVGDIDITNVTYNGEALTAADVAEAAEWGLGRGHFVLWLNGNGSSIPPFTLGTTNGSRQDTTITITIPQG